MVVVDGATRIRLTPAGLASSVEELWTVRLRDGCEPNLLNRYADD